MMHLSYADALSAVLADDPFAAQAGGVSPGLLASRPRRNGEEDAMRLFWMATAAALIAAPALAVPTDKAPAQPSPSAGKSYHWDALGVTADKPAPRQAARPGDRVSFPADVVADRGGRGDNGSKSPAKDSNPLPSKR
jgi:hypothetical protein